MLRGSVSLVYGMFYLVTIQYAPNSASTNRIMAYVKGFSELGFPATVVFFEPDRLKSMVTSLYPNIEFVYKWERLFINIPRLKKIFIRSNIKAFVRRLKEGDMVYVYGFPDLVKKLSDRNDIRVFSEITEHPQASFPNYISRTSVEEYIQAVKKVSGVVVISSALKDYFIDNGCTPEKVHVVNMIVDSVRFRYVEKQAVEPYIAYCGTASNTKDGVDQLIKSFAIVLRNHPYYKLLIIGPTPSKRQRFDNLELVKTLKIEDKVVFTGMVSSTDIPQLLKNAEILALDRPDNLQAQFGFPTKLGEYLLTGNPVVLTRVGDIPLFLTDKENALITEPDNPSAFAEKICWAIDNPTESKLIGAKGKLTAEMFFDYRKETKKIIHFLND